MSHLSYYTRDESSPQGKPKVYFSFHERDRFCLDDLVSTLLKQANAAFFYADSPVIDEVEHFNALSGMNLFVIPVTAKFLSMPSFARDKELAFARKHNIPLLPLMLEKGLSEPFHEIFGDLQYLDPYAVDSSAISYEEKLGRYLSALLVSDELTADIRRAFDCRIFLSYRKKDRRYLPKLLARIRENPLLRDVAVWYDEYLTAGEDFNETIEKELKGSSLVLFAVTPHLTEGKNYIVTREYPMAKALDKPIVAVALDEFSKFRLKRKFPKMPTPIPICESSRIHEAVNTALADTVNRQNDADPRHNYLIGLAYLSGIEVEKNPSLALTLLKKAANTGYPDAIEKLVTVYENGDGVERNYQAAIRWQEELLLRSHTAWTSENTLDTVFPYLYDLKRLASLLMLDCRSAEAVTIFEEMLNTVRLTQKTHVHESLTYYEGLAYENLATLHLNADDYDTAEHFYRKLLTSEKVDGNSKKSSLALLHLKFSELFIKKKQFEKAKSHVTQALSLIADYENQDSPHDSAYVKAYCHYMLAEICQNERDMPAAEAEYCEAYRLFSERTDETDYRSQSDLAFITVSLAEITFKKRELPSAKRYARKALRLCLELLEKTNTLTVKRLLGKSYILLGRIADAENENASAHLYLLSAIDALEAVYEKTEDNDDLNLLAKACCLIGDVYLRCEDYVSAEPHYQKAVILLDGVRDELKYRDHRINYATLCTRLGSCLIEEDKLDEAECAMQNAITCLNELLYENRSPLLLNALSSVYLRLRDLAVRQQSYEAAEAHIRCAVTLLEEMTDTDKTANAFLKLASAYHGLGMTLEKQKRFDEAIDCVEYAISIYKQLSEQMPENRSLYGETARMQAVLMYLEKQRKG